MNIAIKFKIVLYINMNCLIFKVLCLITQMEIYIPNGAINYKKTSYFCTYLECKLSYVVCLIILFVYSLHICNSFVGWISAFVILTKFITTVNLMFRTLDFNSFHINACTSCIYLILLLTVILFLK